MSKIASFISPGFIKLDRTKKAPLHRQLYVTLRREILAGQLKGGTRLPSTRALAQELQVSRNTVINAFNQLLAEGYLKSKTGFGTYVTDQLPEEILQVVNHHLVDLQSDHRSTEYTTRPTPRLSRRANAVLDIPYHWEEAKPRAFCPTLPAVDAFPLKLWEKMWISSMRQLSSGQLGELSALGYRPLREALSTYLHTARGVRCNADQVIITTGTQQALTTTINLLLDRDDMAWVENPSYVGIRAALRGALVETVPIRVDGEGLVVEDGIATAPDARLAFISPSHQFPLGVTMSLARRLRLLQWAEEAQSWIVEDDYDSEYRYGGYPIAALQGLDSGGRVIYIGSFSKVLYPALRVGYMVVPKELVKPLHAARAHADRGVALLGQVALTKFITEGHFARHIRRMRALYAERQSAFIEAARTYLGGYLEVQSKDTGLHTVGWLPEGVDDRAISQMLLRNEIDAPALSSFSLSPLPRGGLVLGYGSIPVEETIDAVKRMRGLLDRA